MLTFTLTFWTALLSGTTIVLDAPTGLLSGIAIGPSTLGKFGVVFFGVWKV